MATAEPLPRLTYPGRLPSQGYPRWLECRMFQMR